MCGPSTSVPASSARTAFSAWTQPHPSRARRPVASRCAWRSAGSTWPLGCTRSTWAPTATSGRPSSTTTAASTPSSCGVPRRPARSPLLPSTGASSTPPPRIRTTDPAGSAARVTPDPAGEGHLEAAVAFASPRVRGVEPAEERPAALAPAQRSRVAADAVVDLLDGVLVDAVLRPRAGEVLDAGHLHPGEGPGGAQAAELVAVGVAGEVPGDRPPSRDDLDQARRSFGVEGV